MFSTDILVILFAFISCSLAQWAQWDIITNKPNWNKPDAQPHWQPQAQSVWGPPKQQWKPQPEWKPEPEPNAICPDCIPESEWGPPQQQWKPESEWGPPQQQLKPQPEWKPDPEPICPKGNLITL